MPTLSYSKVTDAGAGWTRVETTDGRSLTVKGDRAMRNNNPGNIEYGSFAKSHGAIGTDGRFAVFPDRQTGVKAQSSLIFGKPSYKNLTLAEAISRYAPEFENNTTAYAATVAANAGVSLDTKMKDIPEDKRTAVLEAMHGVEGNTAAKAYDATTGEFVTTVDTRQSRLPDQMTAPQTREQVMAMDAVARAYRDPMRALDTVASAALAPDRPVPAGDIQRAALGPASLAPDRPMPMGAVRPNTAPPSTFPGRPGVPGSMPAAPPQSSFPARPSVPGALPGRQPSSFPARPSAPATGMPAAAVQSSFPSRPSVPGSMPAARPQSNFPSRPEVVGSLPAAKPQSDFPARPEVVGSLPASQAPSTAALADQYAQYRTPTNYENVRKAMTAVPEVALPDIPAPAVAPPAEVVPPAAVLAPALVPRPPVQDMPVYQAPPAPPAATASDVYSGLAKSALDNTGMNTVARDAYGNTTVTNQYGATTGMTPGGYQTAYGSMPSVPGMSMPSMGKFGSAVKGAMPTVAGSALGGLFGGPMGAIVGAALAKAVTKPGGLLSGMNSFNTDFFGTINASKPRYGGQFPGAPSGPNNASGWSSSGQGHDRAMGISPGATHAIDRAGGGSVGLY